MFKSKKKFVILINFNRESLIYSILELKFISTVDLPEAEFSLFILSDEMSKKTIQIC